MLRCIDCKKYFVLVALEYSIHVYRFEIMTADSNYFINIHLSFLLVDFHWIIRNTLHENKCNIGNTATSYYLANNISRYPKRTNIDLVYIREEKSSIGKKSSWT